jgi:hypothetical protein
MCKQNDSIHNMKCSCATQTYSYRHASACIRTTDNGILADARLADVGMHTDARLTDVRTHADVHS